MRTRFVRVERGGRIVSGPDARERPVAERPGNIVERFRLKTKEGSQLCSAVARCGL